MLAKTKGNVEKTIFQLEIGTVVLISGAQRHRLWGENHNNGGRFDKETTY